MKISNLRIKNFRCFENLEVALNPRCNIFVGVNGAGKSTILDAVAVALGGYLSGFDDVSGKAIAPGDVHYKMYSVGSRIEPQEQFPVSVYAEAEVCNGSAEKNINWQRDLNGKKRKTTHGSAKQIIEYAKMLQGRIREGDAECILPFMAYYGTGRLWLQKTNRKSYKNEKQLNRQMGYTDCLSAASNDKQMLQWFEEMTYIQLQEGKTIAELETVKHAIRQCYIGADASVSDASFFYDVKSHELEVVITKGDNKEKFPVRMLSDGEKGMISLVADIAYRMAVLNPNLLERVLETPGIVLIDEVDLHLHPAWQKRVADDLMNIFPNVQFIMTTHAPSVLANVKTEYVWILNRFELFRPQDNTYGRTVEEILGEVMLVDVTPDVILKLQKEFDASIDDENYTNARNILEKLKEILGENAKTVIENQIVLDVEDQEG